MKRIRVTKQIKVELLQEELTRGVSEFYGLVYREDTDALMLIVGDETDEAALLALVDQHDYTALTEIEAAEEEEVATNLAAVKEADRVVAESTDPLAVLEARIVRLETYIKQL